MKKCSVYGGLLTLMLLLSTLPILALSKKTQFEQKRRDLLQRIKNIQQILVQIETKKKVSVGQLTAIDKQIEANNLFIQAITQEIAAIDKQLVQQLGTIATLEQSFEQLKKEYAAMIYIGAKAMHDIKALVFILSANSFQELVYRLRYAKQYAIVRKKNLQSIRRAQEKILRQKTALEQQGCKKTVLLQERHEELAKLTDLKQQQARVLTALEQQHTKLMRELTQRNNAVKNLDKLIADIIQQNLTEVKKHTQQDSTKLPLQADSTLGANFAQSRGKLPWPVKSGFVSNQFGVRTHPVLREVRIENPGIDIQTTEGAMAHAVFEGIVKTIAFVPGMHRVVIIQHKVYHTVYARLKNTLVKVGQHVQTGTPIGIVYTNQDGITELQLQLWKGNQKLNPMGWLVRGRSR